MFRLAAVLILAALCGCSSLNQPPDLPTVKERVAAYMEDGGYERDVQRALKPAWRIVERVCHARIDQPKPAIVFDIDETALLNYEYEKGLNFGHYGPAFYQWLEEARATANPPVLHLYERARACGIAVFFVTGRRQRFREPTAANLRAVGYEEWEGLYMKPDDYARKTAVPYKTECRAEIEAQGFEIILNIGDQQSDLDGGHARQTIRLPNPMYRVN